MQNEKKPEIIVFAGPNGSGKSTVTILAKIILPYINADEIKKNLQCEDMEAAKIAERLREKAIADKKSFTFETVLSTRRNLDLLIRAKKEGYFIRCVYVLTVDPKINVWRVFSRVASGGHPVPKDKIIKRWHRSLAQVAELVEICDVIHIYDNSDEPSRIFKKRKDEMFYWPNDLWSKEKIEELVKRTFNKDNSVEHKPYSCKMKR